MTKLSENHKGNNANTMLVAVPSVCLAWATKKRHIAVNNKVLCEHESKCDGYSVKNGCYNSIALSGLPTYKKDTDDTKYTHFDGIIEFKPLSEQKVCINTRSICSKCLSKYERLFSKHGNGTAI